MLWRRTCFLVVALSTAYVAAGAVANLIPPGSRALGSLCLITMLSMLASASSSIQPRRLIASMVAATALSVFVIFCWRRVFDSMAVIGPVPRPLESVALVALGTLNIVAGTVAAVVFSAGHRVLRSRWLVLGTTGLLLFALCVISARWNEQAASPQGLLRQVVILERAFDQNDWAERQELSTALAILGRQFEARAIPLRPDVVGQALSDAPDTPGSAPPIVVRPWRDALTRIAADQRLVMIMEAHTLSEHRAWIEQTLGVFQKAGFTHYFAEAITEPGAALKSRGYPSSRTGFYTLDPRFGNLVRTAIRLGFEIDGYDLGDRDFNRREASQAAALAQQFTSHPDFRMVVHAGHGHIFKHKVRNVGRYMAARLWESTGVEPFTIWQLSNERPNEVYLGLIRQIGPITEPVILIPPPRHVTETLFPESTVQPAVDAIVIHPPRIGHEPADRRGAFSEQMTRVPGVWLGNQWPVVIAAIPDGEPDEAIALDQIMLRQGETDFELWLPQADYTIRVWNLNRSLHTNATMNKRNIRIEIVR